MSDSYTPPTSTADIYRCALMLVQKHGADAPAIAGTNADDLLEEGEEDLHRAWERIAEAVEELLREEPEPGESTH